MKVTQRLMQLDEIHVEEKLYPRVHVDFYTVARYINAMKSGAVFPAIRVAKSSQSGLNVLVDGKHRIEAIRGCKENYIQVDFIEGLTDKEIFIEAVKSNINHGKRFTTQEVTQIAITMQDFNMSLNQISEIIRIPVDKIEPFIAKRIMRINETGQKIALKKPLIPNLSEYAQGPQGFEEGIKVQAKSQVLDGRSQIRTVDSLITLFKNNWVEDSETLRGKLKKLKDHISNHLEKYKEKDEELETE